MEDNKIFIDAVEDRGSGNNLDEILSGFNMYFLSYNGSREQTRLQVPMSIRKMGLWITYVLYDKTVITEWYSEEAIDDDSWKNLSNWRVGSNMLVGDISISSDGYWVINGGVTTIKAQGEQGITPMLRVGGNNHLQVSYTNGSSWTDVSTNSIFTQFRVNNNKLEQSLDLGNTWTVVSDSIAAWFRWQANNDNLGRIQISRDNNTWENFSPEFINRMLIKGFVTDLPQSAEYGDIYMVGPYYNLEDSEQVNPYYRMWVMQDTWVDAGYYNKSTYNYSFNYNIKKTYPSVSAMNADKNNPIGTNKLAIQIGDIVTVINSTTPSENGIYSYEGAADGWKFQSSFNFQLEQTRSQNPNTSPSSKLFSDEIVKFQDDLDVVNNSWITGWSNSVIVTDTNSNVFGKLKAVKQIVVATHTNNTMAFNITKNAYTVGDIINVQALIYTPIDFDIIFSIYTNDSGFTYSWVNGQSQKLKVGTNYIHAAIKITSANFDATSNLQFFFKNLGLIGNTLYMNSYWYIGQKKNFLYTTSFDDKYIAKESGKALSSNDYTNEDKSKLSNLSIITLYENQSKGLNYIGVEGGLTKTTNPDGSIKLVKTAGSGSGWKGINLALDTNFAWVKNHIYYIAWRIKVNTNSLSKSKDGNNYFTVTAKANASNLDISSAKGLSSILTGEESISKGQIIAYDLNDYIVTNPTSKWLYYQFGKYEVSDYLDVDVYETYVIDLTSSGLTYEEMDAYVTINGLLDISLMTQNAQHSITSDRATVAESIEQLSVRGDIDVWGDSLVAQGWATNLGLILGRNAYTHGYWGKKSTYIRDQFLLGSTISTRTQIINVGRNNYSSVETIIDDVRAMVSAMGHQNFLICMPPNGNYGTLASSGSATGEMKGGTAYSYFTELSERLKNEWGSNFIDTRKGTINSYKNGGVTLLSTFTQPPINSNVQISVSDSAFLTTYNPADVTKFGPTVMNRIVIGINNIYDIYEVISVDSSTLMTVKLISANRVLPGSPVSNLIDDGGTSSVIYLRVMQNADYECFLNDTTQSTFRSDGVHMSTLGKQCLAEVVARKIVSMKI